MLADDFVYELPAELIAQKPIEPRNASRLMVLDPLMGSIKHCRFYDFSDFLSPGDTLILNDTRVLSARLLGIREPTGARIEVFLLRRLADDSWETLVRPGKKAKVGQVVRFADDLSAKVMAYTDFGGRIVKFCYEGIFEEILERLGKMPLPPYINEIIDDKERYQTVYCRKQGSVAAPTAGLHFTKEQLTLLRAKGVNVGFVTLHVGLGTFRPVNVSNIKEHKMHSEYYCLPEKTAALIRRTKEEGHRVIAVGTTSTRTLEAAAEATDVLTAKSGWTDIFIYPGYRFKVVDALLTNFHLPKSTLLMLISAFAGRDFVLYAYKEAVRERYRFFSFGDAMFFTCRAISAAK